MGGSKDRSPARSSSFRADLSKVKSNKDHGKNKNRSKHGGGKERARSLTPKRHDSASSTDRRRDDRRRHSRSPSRPTKTPQPQRKRRDDDESMSASDDTRQSKHDDDHRHRKQAGKAASRAPANEREVAGTIPKTEREPQREHSPDELGELLKAIQATQQKQMDMSEQQGLNLGKLAVSVAKEKIKVRADLTKLEAASTSHEGKIKELDNSVKDLYTQLGRMALATPDRDPHVSANGDPDREFNSRVDDTILRINTHDRLPVAKAEVLKLITACYEDIGIGSERFVLLGEAVGSVFVIQFTGDAGYATHTQEMSHAGLKNKLGGYKDLVVPAPTAPGFAAASAPPVSTIKIYIKRDANHCMRSAEILTKRLKKIILAECKVECKIKPTKGMLFSSSWQRVAWIEPKPGNAKPTVHWKRKVAETAGINVDKSQESFLASLDRAGAGEREEEGEWESF